MKKPILCIAVLLSIITTSCGNDPHPKSSIPGAGSYELDLNNNDTINLIDLEGKKQGKWITKNSNGSKDTVYYKNGVAQ
ncbi:MAG: hypothetical protein V4549_19760 [Bacteroidota bacterium]